MYAGQKGQYYLIYFGKDQPAEWPFVLPDDGLRPGMRLAVDVVDTWDMTITPVKQTFEVERISGYKFADKGKAAVSLPGKPYMALRIRRAD